MPSAASSRPMPAIQPARGGGLSLRRLPVFDRRQFGQLPQEGRVLVLPAAAAGSRDAGRGQGVRRGALARALLPVARRYAPRLRGLRVLLPVDFGTAL